MWVSGGVEGQVRGQIRDRVTTYNSVRGIPYFHDVPEPAASFELGLPCLGGDIREAQGHYLRSETDSCGVWVWG